jgi:putative addiction module component (TIGR02574 family)
LEELAESHRLGYDEDVVRSVGNIVGSNPDVTTIQDILNAARALPPAERAQPIHALWDTVSSDDWAPPGNRWIAEAQRRSQEYDAGRMTASPWPEVRERARRKAGLDG